MALSACDYLKEEPRDYCKRRSRFASEEGREGTSTHQSFDMKICHALVCFIFLTLHSGNAGPVQERGPMHRGEEGGNIEVECKFSYSGTNKVFCRENCEQNNILIETTKNTAKIGRHSIKYVEKNYFSSDSLYVRITQLKTSDSGWYMCYLPNTWGGNLSHRFYILVTEATRRTRTTTTTTKSLSFSSETSTASSASTETSQQPERSPVSSGPLSYVGLILVVMITALSAAVLIFCKRRGGSKPKGAPVETEFADITEANRLYEEIRDGDSSHPIAVSSACTYTEYSHPDGDENMDFYSLATSPQNKVEGDANDLYYAEVDFSHVRATNSAPCGNTTDVVYATPEIHTSSAHHIKYTSPPLYATIEKHQQ